MERGPLRMEVGDLVVHRIVASSEAHSLLVLRHQSALAQRSGWNQWLDPLYFVFLRDQASDAESSTPDPGAATNELLLPALGVVSPTGKM